MLPKFIPSRTLCSLVRDRKYNALHPEDTGTMTGEEADAAKTVLKTEILQGFVIIVPFLMGF